jgi:hypothetical protein
MKQTNKGRRDMRKHILPQFNSPNLARRGGNLRQLFLTAFFQMERRADIGRWLRSNTREGELSLSETQSCWQLISNRAMLLPYARDL